MKKDSVERLKELMEAVRRCNRCWRKGDERYAKKIHDSVVEEKKHERENS